MEGLIYLIPAALFLGLIGLIAFMWALKSGQFEDLDGAAERILFDDENAPAAKPLLGCRPKRFPAGAKVRRNRWVDAEGKTQGSIRGIRNRKRPEPAKGNARRSRGESGRENSPENTPKSRAAAEAVRDLGAHPDQPIGWPVGGRVGTVSCRRIGCLSCTARRNT
jgi:cbb3-type cytochrome oxidase maturation protein